MRYRSGSKVPVFVDDLPVTLLAQVMRPNVDEWVLHLDEEVSQRDGLCPRGVGAIAGNMKHMRVVDEERNTIEPILESQPLHHVLAGGGLFHCDRFLQGIRFHR